MENVSFILWEKLNELFGQPNTPNGQVLISVSSKSSLIIFREWTVLESVALKIIQIQRGTYT